MYIDTHTHLDDPAFDPDRNSILSEMSEKGIYAVDSGADLSSSRAAAELAVNHPFIYASVGIHPEYAADVDDTAIEELEKLTSSEKVVAIGETGLDYHYPDGPDRDLQKAAFIRQLELARKLSLPVVVHSRDAAADTLEILKSTHYEGRRIDLHCYGYSAETAAEFVKLGAWFGIGGVLTFKNGRKLREALSVIPKDRILLETDAPYLSPEPHRGERNSPLYLPLVAGRLAELLEMSTDEVESLTLSNTGRFYGISL